MTEQQFFDSRSERALRAAFFAAFGGQPAFLAISAAGALLLLRRRTR